MANSVTVGIRDASRDGTFRVDSSIQHVHASQGERSNSVQVANSIPGAKSANVSPDQPAPSSDLTGETVMTTYGPAKSPTRNSW